MTTRPIVMMRPLVLRSIVLLIVCATASGIGAAAASRSGEIGERDARIIYTALLATGGATLLLPCFLAHEARRPYPLTVFPGFAVATLLLGFGLSIAAVWSNYGATFDHSAESITLIGAAMAHICLISLVRLRRKLIALQLVSISITSVLVALLVNLLWQHDMSDAYRRLVEVIGVAAAVSILLVPTVHRLTRSWPQERETPKVASYCPHCGAVLRTLSRESRCQACSVRFRVRFF